MKNCSCHGEGGRSADPVMGTLTRPRYVPGLILEDSDLTAAVDYTRELNRLLFRSLFGCGVVCGLKVTLDDDCGLTVMVAPGLALDGCGDPIQLIGSASIKLEAKDGVIVPRDPPRVPQKHDFWVIACAKEKNCAPRALVCDSDDLDGTSQTTRTRSAVEVSVSFEPPERVCGCVPFDPKAKPDELNDRANKLIGLVDDEATIAAKDQSQGSEAERGADASREAQPKYSCGPDRFGCHETHYTSPNCPADCGCGTACACGCCVLLAWVHWDDRPDGGWRVLHEGVRRFVRPCLMPDPIRDGRVQDQQQPAPPPPPPDDAADHLTGKRDSEPTATVEQPVAPRSRTKSTKEAKSSAASAKGQPDQSASAGKRNA